MQNYSHSGVEGVKCQSSPYSDQAAAAAEPPRDMPPESSIHNISPTPSRLDHQYRKRKGRVKNNKRRGRGQSKRRMDTYTSLTSSTHQDSLFYPKFEENDPYYLSVWWKIFTTICYFIVIYYSTLTAHHPVPRHQNLVNTTHGFTMAAVVILAHDSDSLVRVLLVDGIAFFWATMVTLKLNLKRSILLFYCHQLEVMIGALGYRRWGGKLLEENARYSISLHGMIGFWLFPVGLAPSVVALFGAAAFNIILGAPFVNLLELWWTSDGLGSYMSFWWCIVLQTVTKTEFFSLWTEEKRMTTSIYMAEILLQIAVIYLIYHPMMHILNLLCLPMLSFIAWRHHIAVSTFLQMFATTFVTILFSRKATVPTGVEITAFYITMGVTLFVSTLIAVSSNI